MLTTSPRKDIYIGISLAVLATIIWSGNFIVARGVSQRIGPVSLAFYRWLTATLIMIPLALKKYREEKAIIKANWKYLFWTALTGIALFNTCVYVAGHYTTAINLALIGTTSSPIFSGIMAVVFLKESMGRLRVTGYLLCIAGILLLLSRGSWQTLAVFHFSKGDLWVIAGALSFACYSILVRKKPMGISPLNFLFVIFAAGTLMLFPFYLIEMMRSPAVQWDLSLAGIILYLGAGASVTAFLCWNAALHKLGAARTVLFGNLIPIFSVWEAVLFLGERVNTIHLLSGLLVLCGLAIANIQIRPITKYEVRSTN